MARGITSLRELIAALLEIGARLDDEVAVQGKNPGSVDQAGVCDDALEIRAGDQGGGVVRWVVYVP